MSGDILDRLTVWSEQRIAGELAIDRGGAMHFTYASAWLGDSSARALPKQEEAFGDALCKAVFGGLLPEEGQRTAIARALGVSPDNSFRLLAALGGDVAGALAFLPNGEAPPPAPEGEPSDPLAEDALADLIGRLPRVPMLAGEGGARLSLAGAQGKLPVVLIGEAIAVPRVGEASTHLIKPEPDRFPGLAANEAFCLALARRWGSLLPWRRGTRPMANLICWSRAMIAFTGTRTPFGCIKRISRKRWACHRIENMPAKAGRRFAMASPWSGRRPHGLRARC